MREREVVYVCVRERLCGLKTGPLTNIWILRANPPFVGSSTVLCGPPWAYRAFRSSKLDAIWRRHAGV